MIHINIAVGVSLNRKELIFVDSLLSFVLDTLQHYLSHLMYFLSRHFQAQYGWRLEEGKISLLGPSNKPEFSFPLARVHIFSVVQGSLLSLWSGVCIS